MGYKIEEIEGIGPAYGKKLAAVKIESTDDLLARCGDASGRRAIAESTGLSEKLLLDWANMADMMRISGIGPQFAELLEASGVDTVKELQHRRADNLAEALVEVNKQKKLARTTPASSVIQDWIDAAKTMKPGISH